MTTTVNDPALRPQRDGGLASGDCGANTLEEMCEFVADCPHFTPEWTDHGYLVIRNQNIRNGRLDLSNPSFTHKDDYDRRTKRATPEPGDIIFTREAPMGEVCMLPKGVECCVGQRQVLLRPRKDVHGPYLLYVLQSPFVRRQIFWNEGTGSTVSNVRIPTLKALLIPRLGSSERFAADCLRALDDKIELNRRTNETLEAMARALFKSWFVDFEPVRAKMVGRDTGLPQSIAAVFPTEIARMDGQDAPVGWSAYSLNDIVVHHTATVSPSTTPDVLFEHYSIPAHDAGQTPTLEPGVAIKSNKTRVPREAMLLSKINPHIPRVWAPNDPQGALQICSTEFLAFAPLAPGSRSLLFSLFSDDRFRTMLRSLVTGTSKSHQRVPPKSLKAQLAITGEPNAFRAFDSLARPWLNQVISNRVESQSLAKVRDLLLPKLISGEIRTAQAERAVDAVTGAANA